MKHFLQIFISEADEESLYWPEHLNCDTRFFSIWKTHCLILELADRGDLLKRIGQLVTQSHNQGSPMVRLLEDFMIGERLLLCHFRKTPFSVWGQMEELKIPLCVSGVLSVTLPYAESSHCVRGWIVLDRPGLLPLGRICAKGRLEVCDAGIEC